MWLCVDEHREPFPFLFLDVVWEVVLFFIQSCPFVFARWGFETNKHCRRYNGPISELPTETELMARACHYHCPEICYEFDMQKPSIPLWYQREDKIMEFWKCAQKSCLIVYWKDHPLMDLKKLMEEPTWMQFVLPLWQQAWWFPLAEWHVTASCAWTDVSYWKI